MNFNQFKTPAIIFAAGGGFFYFEHFHRSILEHGYHIGLLAVGMYAALWFSNRQATKNANERTIIYRDAPPAIGYDPEVGQKINLGQKAKVQG